MGQLGAGMPALLPASCVTSPFCTSAFSPGKGVRFSGLLGVLNQVKRDSVCEGLSTEPGTDKVQELFSLIKQTHYLSREGYKAPIGSVCPFKSKRVSYT